MIITERALARTDGYGLNELLRGLGQSFADHARYANLLLERPTNPSASRRIRAAIDQLTARARAAGTVRPDVTAGDVMALIWAMRGLIQTAGEVAPAAWPRFLDIHLAGLSGAPSVRLLLLTSLGSIIGSGELGPGELGAAAASSCRGRL